MSDDQLTQLAINTIRTLSIDAVQAAKSGHSGTPMALAPLVYTTWNCVMRFGPRDPIWPNRDCAMNQRCWHFRGSRLGLSFRHRGEELLPRLENLEAAAAKGSTAGISFLILNEGR